MSVVSDYYLPQLEVAMAKVERLRAALKPFADYADPTAVFPPTIDITTGSRFAVRQLTMGDCYEAARALDQTNWRHKITGET